MKKTIILAALLSCFTLPALMAQLIDGNTALSKSWTIGIESSYGPSVVENKILSSMDIETNSHEWELSKGYGYKAAVNLNYFINDFMGFKTGLAFHTYESTFSLKGLFVDEKISKDLNDDIFHKVVLAAYDSAISLNYISIPLLVSFETNKPGKNGFYAEAGLNFAFRYSTDYHSTGTYEYYGFYPNHPPVVQTLKIPELGYYERLGIDETGKYNSTGLNVSTYASIGFSFAYGNLFTLKLGPEIYYGITDTVHEETYIDIFGRTKKYKPTIISKYGLKMCLVFRL